MQQSRQPRRLPDAPGLRSTDREDEFVSVVSPGLANHMSAPVLLHMFAGLGPLSVILRGKPEVIL